MRQSICDLRADLAEVHAGPGQRPQFPPFPLHSYLDVDAGWIPFRTPPPDEVQSNQGLTKPASRRLCVFCDRLTLILALVSMLHCGDPGLDCAAVRGVLPNDVLTLVNAQRFGSAGMELTYKTADGRLGDEVLHGTTRTASNSLRQSVRAFLDAPVYGGEAVHERLFNLVPVR